MLVTSRVIHVLRLFLIIMAIVFSPVIPVYMQQVRVMPHRVYVNQAVLKSKRNQSQTIFRGN